MKLSEIHDLNFIHLFPWNSISAVWKNQSPKICYGDKHVPWEETPWKLWSWPQLESFSAVWWCQLQAAEHHRKFPERRQGGFIWVETCVNIRNQKATQYMEVWLALVPARSKGLWIILSVGNKQLVIKRSGRKITQWELSVASPRLLIKGACSHTLWRRSSRKDHPPHLADIWLT